MDFVRRQKLCPGFMLCKSDIIIVINNIIVTCIELEDHFRVMMRDVPLPQVRMHFSVYNMVWFQLFEACSRVSIRYCIVYNRQGSQ